MGYLDVPLATVVPWALWGHNLGVVVLWPPDTQPRYSTSTRILGVERRACTVTFHGTLPSA